MLSDGCCVPLFSVDACKQSAEKNCSAIAILFSFPKMIVTVALGMADDGANQDDQVSGGMAQLIPGLRPSSPLPSASQYPDPLMPVAENWCHTQVGPPSVSSAESEFSCAERHGHMVVLCGAHQKKVWVNQ